MHLEQKSLVEAIFGRVQPRRELLDDAQRLRLQRQLFKFNTTSYYHITINTECHVSRATDATVRTQELLHCAMRRQP